MFSIVISHLLLKISGPFHYIITAILIVGIVIHEFFHIIMCVITVTPIKDIKLVEIIKKEETINYKRYNFNGEVRIKEGEKVTFLQAALVGVAPLFFSFWLCFLLLDFLVHPRNEISFFLSFFIILSIIISAAPSSRDLKNIPDSFMNNPEYSFYQIILLTISILTVWGIVSVSSIPNLHEIFIYMIIMIFYYIWKYGFKILNSIYNFFRIKRRIK